MRLITIIRIALRALRRNKMRTLLTMLGIIIGVGAVIAMVAIGNGAKAQIESEIANMGQNVIMVFSGSLTRGGVRGGWGSAPTLTLEDAQAILREVPGVVAVSPEVRSSFRIAVGNQDWYTQVLGVSAEYLQIRNWACEAGTGFSEMDVRSANKVAILGRTVATQLFGDEDPIGKIVRIRNIPFTVVGVLKSRGFSMVGFDQDDLVLVPYTTAMRRLLNVTNLRTIIVQAQSAQLLPFIQDQITLLLRQLHKIGADKEDDFTVRTQQDIAEFATAQSRTMTILLGAIAGVSLIVGGIGIMNIMLVSVTERTREIGIRMAVGARPKDILLQFLIEAVTLSVLGGFLGIGLGVAVAHAIASKTGWPILTPMYAVVGAFVFSAVIGIFFGFYPARKASRLDPIEALRYE